MMMGICSLVLKYFGMQKCFLEAAATNSFHYCSWRFFFSLSTNMAMASTFIMMADWKKKKFDQFQQNWVSIFQFSNQKTKCCYYSLHQAVCDDKKEEFFFKSVKYFSNVRKKPVHLMMPDFRQSISFLSSLFNNSIL